MYIEGSIIRDHDLNRGNMYEGLAILQRNTRQQGNRQQATERFTQKCACVHQSRDYVQLCYLVNLRDANSVNKLHSLELLTTQLNISSNNGEGKLKPAEERGIET